MAVAAAVKTFNEQRVLEMMYDYHWSMKRLQDMRESLNKIFTKTTAYGVEATMPKAQGGVGDPVYNEILRRERAAKALDPLREKVLFIQHFTNSPAYDRMDWKNKLILDLTLEGMSQRQIADEMQMHHNTIHNRQKQIAKMIVQSGQAMTC